MEIDFDLTPKQKTALHTAATEILYGGAAGGGKSHLMRAAAILWCAAIPGLQVYIFRRTFPDLNKNHMEGPTSFPNMLSQWVKDGLAKINYSSNKIVFWNGSTIHLCHCQHEKNKYDYQGAEIHVLMMDELTHFTKTIYAYLRARCRIAGLELPDHLVKFFPRILNGSNPGGSGHNWVKEAFVTNAPTKKIVKMPKKEGGMLRQYIPALLGDNPYLDEDYADRLEGLGNPQLVRAMKKGDWDIVAGGMIDDVWNEKVHILAPFDIPYDWVIDRSFDWGSSRPFSVGWWAESNGSDVTLRDGTTRSFPGGTIFRIAEWYGWNGEANTGCKMLATEIAKGILDREELLGIAGRVEPGPADSSIYDVQNGNCIADDMALMGVTWRKADKGPGSRKNGWEKLRTMLKAGLTVTKGLPMEDPGLFFFNSCSQSRRTLPVLPRSEKDMDDVDTDSEDHIADEVRYRITFKRMEIIETQVVGL